MLALALLGSLSGAASTDSVTPVIYVEHTRTFVASRTTAKKALLPDQQANTADGVGCEGSCDTSNCPFGFKCSGCETLFCAGPTKDPLPRSEAPEGQTCQCKCACKKLEEEPHLPICMPHMDGEPTSGHCDQPMMADRQPRALPSNGSVGILIRGQAFRSFDGKLCDKNTKDKQMDAAVSFLENVVEPLEALGNKVEIVVTDDSKCAGMMKKLIHVYGRSRPSFADFKADRVIGTEIVTNSSGQGHATRRALDAFKRAYHLSLKANPGGSYHGDVPDRYNFFIMTRHDLLWKRPIDRWETVDFRRINFLSRCEVGALKYGGETCVDDAFQIMRGMHFPSFDEAVGSPNCFSTALSSTGHGHACAAELSSRVHEDVSVLTEWRPAKNIDLREDTNANPVAAILSRDTNGEFVMPLPSPATKA